AFGGESSPATQPIIETAGSESARLAQQAEGAMSKKFLSIAAVVLALFPVSSRASTLAYATTGDDQFGIVDLNTGVFTEVGNMGVRLTGLGSAGGTLYGGGYGSGTLYSINPLTGALTTIGSGNLTYWATGSTTNGLFALDNSANMNLYSIN